MLRYFLAAGVTCLASGATAGTIVVPYTGFFDESSVAADLVDNLPAGDYDTIGGLSDVALFNLVEGTNTFVGSIYSPYDPADVFNIGIGAGLEIFSASIVWGTNFVVPFSFTYPQDPGYLVQSSYSQTDRPALYLEESDTTPEVFTISDLVGGPFGDETQTYNASEFLRGEGIYLSSLIDRGATCAQRLIGSFENGGVVTSECAEGVDYSISYEVRALPIDPIPLPAGLPLVLTGLAAFGFVQSRKRAS